MLINDVEELTTVFSYDKIEETIKNRQFSKIKVGNLTAHYLVGLNYFAIHFSLSTQNVQLTQK